MVSEIFFCYAVPLGQGMGSSLFCCQLPRCWMIRLCALSGPFVPTGSGKRELVEQLEVFRLGVPSGEVEGESVRGGG